MAGGQQSFAPPKTRKLPADARAAAQATPSFAAERLQRCRVEISGTMSKHQLALADRQCRMSELSQRVQDLVVMLATSLYGGAAGDEVVRAGGRRALPGPDPQADRPAPQRPLFPHRHPLGEAIADGGFRSIAGLHPDEILMPYKND
jgi:hypothetical protein